MYMMLGTLDDNDDIFSDWSWCWLETSKSFQIKNGVVKFYIKELVFEKVSCDQSGVQKA